MKKFTIFRYEVKIPVTANSLEEAERYVDELVAVATKPFDDDPEHLQKYEVTLELGMGVEMRGSTEDDIETELRRRIEHTARVMGERRPTVTVYDVEPNVPGETVWRKMKRDLRARVARQNERWEKDHADRGTDYETYSMDTSSKPVKKLRKVS
jgi:hypothetical protein